MASLNYFIFAHIFCKLFLLLLLSNLPNVVSQDSSSTTSQCTSSLLPLIPCAPFVQGTAPSPGSECCGNLKQIYTQEPNCLCHLLNNTTLSSFPINRTLALQLPALCNLQVNANISACSGEQMHMPATSPHSQVSLDRKNSSTVISSPAFSVPPRPNMMGFRFGNSKASNLKTEKALLVNAIIAILLFTPLLQ